MLTHLHIRHFAIIDATEIELTPGMTALTGETGAGKSILLDALGLVLGARASADSVQQGQSRAVITASFAIEQLPDVSRWLEQQELDAQQECIVRRTINANGKSRATVNDVPVSVQLLKELGEKLVNIHGQNAHQKLGKTSEQRQLLDAYAKGSQLSQVKQAYEDWHRADTACKNQASISAAREQRLDLLSFQLREFDELDIGSTPIADIESEHRWLASADRIMALGNEVLEALDTQASPALTQCTSPLSELVSIDERLRESLDLIESAGIQVAEATSSVRNLVSQLEHDDARLAWLDQKLAAIHRLTRKHHCDVENLASLENTLREEFDELQNPELSLQELELKRAELRKVYDREAAKLSRHRKKHAKRLSESVTESMQLLNMQGGQFEVQVTDKKSMPEASGADTVEFLVSPNPGTCAAALSRIASGGELSRIGLSLQLATLDSQSVPTLIFDEVDSGVGGAVAENVGRLLRKVGARVQVLCVTHLPQVAAQAHNHLQVSKSVVNGITSTCVSHLDENATREEIARMLGGAKITDKSLQHAQEMLDSVS